MPPSFTSHQMNTTNCNTYIEKQNTLQLYYIPIAKCTLKLEHFLPKVSELCSRMLSQYQSSINKPVLKGFQRYLDVLKNMAKILTISFKNLRIICIQINHDQTNTSCLQDLK